MGIRVYAWRVDLDALRALVGCGDGPRAAEVAARLSGGPRGTLPGEEAGRALQNWQLAGMGATAPPADVEALILGGPLELGRSADWVRSVITLCGLLGECLTHYSFYSYQSYYVEVEQAFAALGVPPELLDLEGEIFFAEPSPPVPIPMPEDGLPNLATFEAARVAAVAERLAGRGIGASRWAEAVAALKGWAEAEPSCAPNLEAFLGTVDEVLRDTPGWAEEVAGGLELLIEDGGFGSPSMMAQGLDFEGERLRRGVEENLNQDATDVFREIARWFEEAAAAGQGVVTLTY